MPDRRLISAAAAAVCLFAPAPALAASPRVAALQVALRHHDAYDGTVDGLQGPQTENAVRRFQRRAGLVPDGIAGPRTRRALGALGRHPIGSRELRLGKRGWDVAALQFSLSVRGFPCGPIDGRFGARTDAAVRRAQTFAGIPQDGVVGPATRAALGAPPPRSPPLARPTDAPIGDGYGPRGNQFHAGVDFLNDAGDPVAAAAAGRVAFAGYDGAWGLTIVLDHGRGLRTRYAHLSAALASRSASVAAGARIGRAGATGRATGPHLHFEVTVRGANAAPPF